MFRLYRFDAEDGALLYLGESIDGVRRILQHEETQRWRGEMAGWRRDPRVFATEAEVLAAERHAIVTERPRFNIQHNQRNPDRVDPRTMRYADGRLYRPEVYHRPGGVVVDPVRPAARLARAERPAPRRDRWRWLSSRRTGVVGVWAVLSGLGGWATVFLPPLVLWQRASLGAAAGTAVLAWWFTASRARRRRRARVAVALAAVAVLLFVAWSAWSPPGSLLSTVGGR